MKRGFPAREGGDGPWEFGYPELWAVVLEKQRPDSGSLCDPSTLQGVWCEREPTLITHPPALPSNPSCPICVGTSGPENPAHSPSQQVQHQRGATYLKRTVFIVTRSTSCRGPEK